MVGNKPPALQCLHIRGVQTLSGACLIRLILADVADPARIFLDRSIEGKGKGGEGKGKDGKGKGKGKKGRGKAGQGGGRGPEGGIGS